MRDLAKLATTPSLLDAPVLAFALLTLLPPLILEVAPAAGPPGTQVGFTVRNLMPGSLRIDYASVPIWGPAIVATTVMSGAFRVPLDRPYPLGAATTLVARNMVAGIVVGKADGRVGPRRSRRPRGSPVSALLRHLFWRERSVESPAARGSREQLGADGLPNVAYRDGLPFIVWARDVDRDPTTLDDHRVAMRLLGGAGLAARENAVSVPAELPDGVAELSLAMAHDGQPRLAFTRAEDGATLVDNRHVLYAASRACDTCPWVSGRLVDTHGRSIWAERPVLTLDRHDRGTITFRGMGFGPTAGGQYVIYPEETMGMAVGTGELAQVEVNFDGEPHDPRYLSDDGAVYWKLAATYDSATHHTFALAALGYPPPPETGEALPDRLTQLQGSRRLLDAVSPVALTSVAMLPDFSIGQLIISAYHPLPGEGIALTVTVRNDGVGWEGGGGTALHVVATWDGGPGLGTPGGSAQIAALPAGTTVTTTLVLTLPDALDDVRELVVTVNPDQEVAESNGRNNSATLRVGGLPMPHIRALAQTDRPEVFLEWVEIDDPRIEGYRIYRGDDGGARVPVGSTFVGGWVDVRSGAGHTYEYVVTSYGQTGQESAPSNAKTVKLIGLSYRDYLPMMACGR